MKSDAERRPVIDRLLDYAGGILAVLVVACMVVTVWAVLQVKSSQDEHHKDLTTIEGYAKQIDQAGSNIEQAIQNNHGASYSVLVTLCHVTPGCVVPPTNTTPTGGTK